MKPASLVHALQSAASGWRVGVCGAGSAALSGVSIGMPRATRAHANGKPVNRLFTLKP